MKFLNIATPLNTAAAASMAVLRSTIADDILYRDTKLRFHHASRCSANFRRTALTSQPPPAQCNGAPAGSPVWCVDKLFSSSVID